MKATNKILLAIPYFLLWVIYFLMTVDDRIGYDLSVQKGARYMGSKDDSFIIPGSATKYYFDPKQKPVRNYLTWKEFWKSKNY